MASWMEERAPSAWEANSTEPMRASSFFTGLGADAEADNLSQFSMEIPVRHPIQDTHHDWLASRVSPNPPQPRQIALITPCDPFVQPVPCSYMLRCSVSFDTLPRVGRSVPRHPGGVRFASCSWSACSRSPSSRSAHRQPICMCPVPRPAFHVLTYSPRMCPCSQ